jgi:DNA-binding transcriptional ArsR family regulator
MTSNPNPVAPDPRRERALAHPLRQRILATLGDEGASREDLAAKLDVSLDVVSYHAQVLSRCGCLEAQGPARLRVAPPG